jgi:hypothetical protein
MAKNRIQFQKGMSLSVPVGDGGNPSPLGEEKI